MSEIGLFGQIISKQRKTSIYEAIVFFQDTPKTEAAFYLKFQVVPLEYLNALKSYYNTDDDLEVFKKLISFFKVKEL